ncbi:MAG: efflux RND transporter periplasmic adaptor subunit [Gammaproteobacteria bacterium]|nr:efflux RND transporter periplasmic adaptor subunit [Gammaproteobacteria bacterium]
MTAQYNFRRYLFRLMLLLFLYPLATPAFSAADQPVVFEAVNRAVLSAERSGVLTKLNFKLGDRVKSGTILATVDSGELKLLKKRAALSLKFLDGQLDNLLRLEKKGLATLDEVNKVRMERDLTRADIAIIERQMAQSRIRAPFAATIVKRHTRAHQWVTEGQPVIELLDSKHLRATANVSASVNIKIDDQHHFRVDDIGASVSGTVIAVSPDVDVTSNTVQVVWRIEQGARGLLAGMKGWVQLVH